MIPVTESLPGDGDGDAGDAEEDGERWDPEVMEFTTETVLGLFLGAAVLATFSWGASQAITVGGAVVGLSVVLYAAVLEVRQLVDLPTLGSLPFPSDERAQTDARSTAKEAAGIVSAVGLVGLVEQYGVGGVLYQLFLTTIGAIQSAGETFLAPIQSFASGIARVVAAAFPARIINEAADFTAFSLTQGQWNFFGPFTFAVAVVAVLLGLWVFVRAGSRINFSPLSFFFGRR